MDSLLLINLFATFALTGLIWTIQVVHYPSFRNIDKAQFSQFLNFHMKAITFVVGPLMLLEIFAAILLLIEHVNPLTVVNFTLVILLWLSTYFLSVPCHNKLKKGYDSDVIKRLIKTNWPRTMLWSAKALLLLLIALK